VFKTFVLQESVRRENWNRQFFRSYLKIMSKWFLNMSKWMFWFLKKSDYLEFHQKH